MLWVDPDEREMLAQAEPEKFFWTPHYERHLTLQVWLAAVDRAELGELLRDSWRRRAPDALLKRLGET